jgi:SAM-dependent methyltransferase
VDGRGRAGARRRPLRAEPEAGACRAARTLFGLPAVRADAAALPFRDSAFRTAWCLGVLCTTPDHDAVLSELHRVVAPGGRVGLLVYAAAQDLSEQPEGNNFPSHTGLPRRLEAAGFTVTATAALAELGSDPEDWQQRADAVEAEIERRHRDDKAWRTSQEQQQTMGRLLSTGQVVGELFCLEVSTA